MPLLHPSPITTIHGSQWNLVTHVFVINRRSMLHTLFRVEGTLRIIHVHSCKLSPPSLLLPNHPGLCWTSNGNTVPFPFGDFSHPRHLSPRHPHRRIGLGDYPDVCDCLGGDWNDRWAQFPCVDRVYDFNDLCYWRDHLGRFDGGSESPRRLGGALHGPYLGGFW